MFKCQVTNKFSKPGDKCNKIVTEKREKVYFQFFRNEETGKWEEKEVGRGWEIVKEINCTDAGLDIWKAKNI
jgi:hypothetical protein